MKNEEDVSVWREQLQTASSLLAQCPDTPDWLKQVVTAAGSVAKELAPGTEVEQVQDTSFFYPH